MKAVCNRYGALLILDEVMCGMGRTGTLHAWEQEGVVPDIQTIGKGLGGGYVPIAGFLAGHQVIETLGHGTGYALHLSSLAKLPIIKLRRQFVHGHTYQAHPMVCAAALEVQNIIATQGLVANAKRMGALLESRLKETLGEHPYVGDIRGRGLFWAVSLLILPYLSFPFESLALCLRIIVKLEFVRDKSTQVPFDPALTVAMAVHEQGLSQNPGIMMYPGTGSTDGKAGDHIIISPPYNVTAEEIEMIVAETKRSVNSTFERIVGQHEKI